MHVALVIRDDTVDALATQLQKALNAPSKTEAVRQALQRELDRVQQARPLWERIAKAQAMAGAMGANDPNFDMKPFTDEMGDNL
jgi:antitoxin VapB